LGVAEDDVASDYALTTRALPSIMKRLSSDPIHGAAIARVPQGRLMASADTMYRFLRLLSERHEGARNWMNAAGVSTATLDSIRAKLTASA
jgi:hypothetical protein